MSSEREYEEGSAGTEADRSENPLEEYRESEPMTPSKIKEHKPTAINREMTEKITEPGNEAGSTTPEEARERARRSGMTKGTAGWELYLLAIKTIFVIDFYYDTSLVS